MEHIKISMTPKASLSICHVTQNDNGREVSIDFEDYTLTGAEDVSLIIRKPDGTRVETALENTASNFVIWSSVPSECDTVGLANCEIKAEDNGVVLYSASFNMNIEADPYGSDVTTSTATGNPCTFTTDLADALVSLTADIVAKQDLHGYDHPWAGGAGKNKLHITATSQTINGITYTVKSDGTITANGTATAESTLVLVNGTGIFDFTTEMVLNGSVDGFDSSVRTRFGVSGVGSYDDFGNGATIPIISDISSRYSYVQITIASGTTVNNVTFKPMISTTGGDFEPYSNICPIVGHSELNLVRCGKNLNPYSGVSYRVDNDRTRFYLPAGTYTFSNDTNTQMSSGANYYIRLYDAQTNGNVITAGNITSDRLTLNGDGTLYYGGAGYETVTFTLLVDAWVCFGFNNNYPTNCTAIQLQAGSTPSAYEPYNGQTFTVAFGQTVYGGVYDKSGRLTITWAGTKIKDLGWYYDNDFQRFYSTNQVDIKHPPTQNDNPYIKCDIYETVTFNNFNAVTRPNNAISNPNANGRINIRDTRFTDTATFIASVGEYYLAYELATPIEIDVTSISVFAENGVNNIVSDCGGDVNVTYIKKV